MQLRLFRFPRIKASIHRRCSDLRHLPNFWRNSFTTSEAKVIFSPNINTRRWLLILKKEVSSELMINYFCRHSVAIFLTGRNSLCPLDPGLSEVVINLSFYHKIYISMYLSRYVHIPFSESDPRIRRSFPLSTQAGYPSKLTSSTLREPIYLNSKSSCLLNGRYTCPS